jgi:predicted dehydrogenase
MKSLKKIALASIFISLVIVTNSCQNPPSKTAKSDKIHLIILDPGHFHAGLIQKSMYPEIDSVVNVYSPGGPELQSYLTLVKGYNDRKEDPTKWVQKPYSGADYLEKMLSDKSGNVVLISGNNKKKAEYIKRSVEGGFNVLGDKPMAIDEAAFTELVKSFETAEKNKVVLYDIMTERYEITNMLQKAFSEQPEVFGTLEKGTLENPAVTKESVHYYFKYVSGAALVRPQWFFDTKQAGDGLVDITTHLVDLVEWECFPDQLLDYKKDVKMISAKHWPTLITPSQFKRSTKSDTYPDYLKKDLKDSVLNVYSNGEMHYAIKGINTKISVRWNFEAPAGTGDTHFSIMRGSKANLIIRQGAEQKYKPMLYVEPLKADAAYEAALKTALEKLNKTYPGLELKRSGKGWQIVIPEKYSTGHEAHFAEVTKKYIGYLKDGKIPAWEKAAILAKYYTTTQALSPPAP